MGRSPNFLIVGAMRSGTSSLASYLDGHPQVFVTPRKEIHYFNRFFDQGFDWYLEHFAGAGDTPQVGEATPNYIYHPIAMKRIAEALPDAKIIAILREPAARAYSHYWFNHARGNEALSFEEAIAAEPDRLSGGDELARARASYVDRGRYADQLERIASYFPPEQVHVLLFEDLTMNTQRTFAEVCQFLGVDSSPIGADLERKVNVYFRVRWPALKRAVRPFPKPIRTAVSLINRAKADPYPPMSAEMADHLAAVFAAPNQRLSKLLGRQLDEWQP